ncbi:MAG: hypothetical protein H7233_07945, partial [Pseudorhodobacter sp.]|nr:hypothetical protein [Frankiaceae bacterium]
MRTAVVTAAAVIGGLLPSVAMVGTASAVASEPLPTRTARTIELSTVETGVLPVTGARQVFTLSNSSAGGSVYVTITAGSNGNLQWNLRAPSGELVYDRQFSGDPGLVPLTASGSYTLTLEAQRGTGSYGFEVFGVPAPQSFPISLGTTVSDGDPGPGAGRLEAPGSLDVYTFSADGGQEIYVRLNNSYLPGQTWSLQGPDG